MLRENVTDRGGNHLRAEMWVERLHVCIQISNKFATIFSKNMYTNIQSNSMLQRGGQSLACRGVGGKIT